jgi:hypothetical protein
VEFGISQPPLEFGISKAKTKEQVDPTILFGVYSVKSQKPQKVFFASYVNLSWRKIYVLVAFETFKSLFKKSVIYSQDQLLPISANCFKN